MSNITAIAKVISQAAAMRKHGQECADQYLFQAVEYGVDYWIAYDLMRAVLFSGSQAEFEQTVEARLDALQDS